MRANGQGRGRHEPRSRLWPRVKSGWAKSVLGMNELVCFVRQGDVARVTSLLASKATDINAVCPVTVRFVEPAGSPVAFAPHEGEVRPSHAWIARGCAS